MAQTPYDYLQADEEGAAKVLAHASTLIRLAGVYQRMVPTHLGQASRLANIKAGTVVIHTESGAVAGKLRQMVPSLLDKFAQIGVHCQGIEVKVRTGSRLTEDRRHAEQKPLSVGARKELTLLSESLPPSALRTAIEQLLVRAATRE